MNPRKELAHELATLQADLASAHGKKYWRSLEELAGTEVFQQLMRREFPAQADIWPDALSRRRFLSLMAASLALAGLSGCSVAPAPSSKIVPYVQQPEELVPGRPLFYATAMTLGGVGVGLLAESHLGRPTKIEGNPWHPGSLGATDLFHQASVLTLYDPDRSQIVTVLGKPSTWDAVLGSLPVQGVPSPGSALARLQAAGRRGAGLCLLTETVVSPTLHSQIQDLKKVYPRARWYQYEPLAPDNVRQASRSAFGKDVHTVYNLKEATRVLSFDADFLGCGPGHLRYVADFASRPGSGPRKTTPPRPR